MPEKLQSRKLFAFLITVLLHLINGYFKNPIDEGTMEGITKLALGYIVGQGAVDALKEFKILANFGTQVGTAADQAVEAKQASSSEASASAADVPSR